MTQFFFSSLLAVTISSCSQDGYQGQNGKTLIWSDEFNINGALNADKWAYDLGDGCPTLCGWGNNELQHYTRDLSNVRVENGHLIIEAHYDIKDSTYSSARIKTANLGSWKYGTIEVRAKLPSGKGFSSAAWMLPENWLFGNWPASGEIDLFEYQGAANKMIYGAVHTAAFNGMTGTQKVDSFKVENLTTDFHTYSVDWTKDEVDFTVDGINYMSYKKSADDSKEWPFDDAFHLILNLAVRESNSQILSRTKFTPQKMIVDYVRVYQKLD